MIIPHLFAELPGTSAAYQAVRSITDRLLNGR